MAVEFSDRMAIVDAPDEERTLAMIGIVVRYGAAWQNATSVLNPRTVKCGVNMSF